MSASRLHEVRAYLENQQEHHRVRTFQEEFREFLEKHNVPYDEKHIWD